MKRQAFLALAPAAAAIAASLPGTVVAAPNVSGTWACAASGEGPNGDQTGHFDLTLKQTGSSVTGTYYKGTASLSGDFKGSTLKGRWQESSSSTGVFTFVFESDGESFTGTWGLKEGDTAGTWSGKRK